MSLRSRTTKLIPLLCVATLCGLASPQARALETDQFSLPPKPLDDIGPEVSAKVLGTIQEQIQKVNEAIDERLKEGTAPSNSPNPDDSSSDAGDQQSGQKTPKPPQLPQLQSARYVAEQIYNELGEGLPEATIERMTAHDDFRGKPNVRFKPNYFNSIYVWVFSPTPFAFFFDSPTVDMYGVDFGTDKVGHFFQQGYEYFDKYRAALDDGATESAAVDTAVQYGAMTESSYYGVVIDGVYSNGDLAANYAGFKFYRNLGDEVTIGSQVIAPILRLENGHWTINPDRANAELLKPYISDHLNEAYNPCKYTFNIDLIRDHVRDRCGNWSKTVPGFSEEFIRAKMDASKTWFGESYGWYLPEDKGATLLECFQKPAPVPSPSTEPSPAPSSSQGGDCDLVQIFSGKCQR